jgi:hypothetical protein
MKSISLISSKSGPLLPQHLKAGMSLSNGLTTLLLSLLHPVFFPPPSSGMLLIRVVINTIIARKGKPGFNKIIISGIQAELELGQDFWQGRS